MSTADPGLKALFLDIDGVLNSGRSQMAFGGFPHSFRPGDMAKFDHVAIGLVRRLCRETGCSVVLSSDWRYDCTAHAAANALDLPIMDVTPINVTGTRAMEIAAWLAAHPEVASYAIVDDIPDIDDMHGPRWVLTDPANGLSMANYSALRRLLTVANT
jgi:hypothetical protein